MHWLNILAVLFVLNKTTLSWKGTPYGQVGCDSPSQCLLQSSNSGMLKRKQEMAPTRDINTWYPIPKWKVFFEANKNRNEYSAPYFNKQDPGRTDGNISDNDFPPMWELKKRAEVFERLNIQFFPLKEGNITVKGFKGKINASGTEYVALFVVYAHSSNMYNTRMQNNSDGDTVTVELEMELMNGKANMSVDCDEPGGCFQNFSVMVLPASLNSTEIESQLFPKGEKIVAIPVTKNMSIEMKMGELKNNIYTVTILPFTKVMNETETGSEEITINGGEIINITLTKNMNMVIKIKDIFVSKETLQKHPGNDNFTEINSVNSEKIQKGGITVNKEEMNEGVTSEELSDSGNNETSTATISTTYDFESNIENFTLGPVHVMLVNTTSDDNLISSTIKENVSTFTTFDLADKTDNSTFNESLDMENIELNKNDANKTKGYELITTQMNTPASEQRETSTKVSVPSKGSFQGDTRVNYINRKPKTGLVPQEVIYSKQFGPYEVKEVNSNHSSFLATIHLTFNDKEINNKNDNKEFIKTTKSNNSYTDIKNLTTILFRKTFQRQKRNASNENSNERHKLYHRKYNIKQKIINEGYFSHENEIGNKYSNRTSRMILNKAEETTPAAGTMNHYSLILPGESTKEQSNSSRLFLFSEGPDSYSYATISNGNEEFNQKSTDKFRNKGLIANEISDNAVGADGAKSNQTAHGVRNKRELAAPTLIPNKDSRENHSVPKKSELQIVEGGSLDKSSDDWKMKIPPGMLYLREDGIKIGKICDLKDGCKGVNDVFNTMIESEYYKEDGVEEESFDSNENLESKGRIDKWMESPHHNFKRKTSGKPVNMEGGYKKESDRFEVESKSILPPRKVRFSESYLNSLQKKVIPAAVIPNINLHIKINSTNGNIKSGTFGQNHYITKAENFSKYGKEKASPPFKERNETGKLEKHVNNEFSKLSASFSKLLRKKRTVSQNIPFLNPTNFVYVMDFDSLSSQAMQQFPRSSFPRIRNASLISPQNERRYGDRSQQNYLLHLLQGSSSTEIENSPNKGYPSYPDNKIKEWWFKRGSTWQPRGRQSKWLPRNQGNDQSITRNVIPEYRWVIIVPEISEQHSPRSLMRSSTKPPVHNRMTQSRKNPSNPDREREDDKLINTEWVLVDTMNEHRNVNTKLPPVMPTSFDIINTPKTISNTPPTTKPPRRFVSRTTSTPVENSTPRNTIKPTRPPVPRTTMKPMRPNFQTTPDPWSIDKPWDTSYWSVSQNPWKRYPIPPMMMGGMTGGD